MKKTFCTCCMPAWVIRGNSCHGSTNTRRLLIRLLKRHIRGRWRSKKKSEILSSSPSLVNHTFQLAWYTKRQVYKAVFTRHELKKYCGYSLHISHILWIQHGMTGSSKDEWEILHFPPIVWWQIYRNSALDYQGTWNLVKHSYHKFVSWRLEGSLYFLNGANPGYGLIL